MSADRPRNVVSITQEPKGVPEEFIWFDCPEEGCDWSSSDWSVNYEDEARGNYRRHWLETHAPEPPEPLSGKWWG